MDKHQQYVKAVVNGPDDTIPRARKAAEEERSAMREKQRDGDPEPLRDKEPPRRM